MLITTSKTTRAHMTDITFDSLQISALSKRAISQVMGYQALTTVQADDVAREP